MQSYNLDGVLFLIHVVGGPKHPAEATLSNKSDVFELFVESACIKDVLERRSWLNLTHRLRNILGCNGLVLLQVFNLFTDLTLSEAPRRILDDQIFRIYG